MTYNISIETNEHSLHITSRSSKKAALKAAAAWRDGGSWAGQLTAAENPHVSCHNATADKVIYRKPLFKKALKK